MHQYLKVEEKSLSQISPYCPLHLFSGDPLLIRKGAIFIYLF